MKNLLVNNRSAMEGTAKLQLLEGADVHLLRGAARLVSRNRRAGDAPTITIQPTNEYSLTGGQVVFTWPPLARPAQLPVAA